MENLDYNKLFELQDRVLELVFTLNTDFYLTGGTCLNRFYLKKRYSDDLDFFTNFSNNFSYQVKEILSLLEEKSLKVEIKNDSRDFKRIVVKNKFSNLDIYFVNDRVKIFGDILINNKGYRLDNVKNILSNKITAIVSRDDPKDVFDLYVISLNTDFSWKEILSNAKQKMHFEKEYLVYRLRSFPKELFKQIKLIDKNILNDFDKKFPILIENIIEESDNKLKT